MAHTEASPIPVAGPRLGLDPEVVFKVDDVIFGIPHSQLLASELFRDILSREHIKSRGEGTEANPIALNAVSLSQVTSFHKVINCRRFDPLPNLTLKQWSEALQLATLWEFGHLRKYIIQILDSLAQDPLDRIELAEKCGFTHWLSPAYAKLCARESPLTVEEGRRLGLERFAALGWIRETELRKSLYRSAGGFHESESAQMGAGRPSVQTGCANDCCRPVFELDRREEELMARVRVSHALNRHYAKPAWFRFREWGLILEDLL